MLRKNDLIELAIEDMGIGGEGIGKYGGMAFFVKDAVIGDTVRARVTKLKKNYGYARLMEVLSPSGHRVQPACGLHRQCGGCQLQALDYRLQLEFKREKVRECLIRIGGFTAVQIDGLMEPPVGMESPYRYRNKAQYPIGRDGGGKLAAGFYAARTHSIIPVSDCMLGVEENRAVVEAVLSYMEEEGIMPYEEATGKGLMRHLLIRYGFATGELMACLVINGKRLPAQDALIRRLCGIKGMACISVNQNRERTNVILGDATETIWGKPYITDFLHLRGDGAAPDTAVAYRISPQSFYQVNPAQAERLYAIALEYAGLSGRETVWDLYCGIGTISLFLAQRAGKVYGVDAVPQAIRDARENAAQNGIGNVEFFAGNAEDVLAEFYGEGIEKGEEGRCGMDMLHPDVIVVDPPRKGCDAKCLETMVKMAPRRIVYVSCDPATLARDLRVLCDGGYELVRGRIVDQFPHTVHVETVCLLSKLNVKQHIEVELTMDELDLTAAEKKASYEEIKAYVLEKYGLKVSHLYIAQVKRQCGIIERENYNKPKSENARQPKCPPEKEAAIRAALEHFKMI